MEKNIVDYHIFNVMTGFMVAGAGTMQVFSSDKTESIAVVFMVIGVMISHICCQLFSFKTKCIELGIFFLLFGTKAVVETSIDQPWNFLHFIVSFIFSTQVVYIQTNINEQVTRKI
jgi:hypothetical protein